MAEWIAEWIADLLRHGLLQGSYIFLHGNSGNYGTEPCTKSAGRREHQVVCGGQQHTRRIRTSDVGRDDSWRRKPRSLSIVGQGGKIMKWMHDLAFREGVLSIERNHAYTSQTCPHCHTQGERNGHHFTYQNPAHTYHADADFVSMMNQSLRRRSCFRCNLRTFW